MTYFNPNKAIAFDTETHLIAPGVLAPRLVCGSYATSDRAHILARNEVRVSFLDFIRNSTILGANIAFDMLVVVQSFGREILPEIFRAYDSGRIYDVQIAEALHAIAHGHLGRNPDQLPMKDDNGKITTFYSLWTCVRLNLGRQNAKENDEWRLRYAELEHLPIEDWPEVARQYPIDDAVNTRAVALRQNESHDNLHDHHVQVYKHFCLHLAAAWGIRANPRLVDDLERAVTEYRNEATHFQELGYFSTGGTKTKEIAKQVALAYGSTEDCDICRGTGKLVSLKTGKPVNCTHCSGTGLYPVSSVPRTDPSPSFPHGQIKTSRDVLVESGHEDLIDFAAFLEDEKISSTYIPFLREATRSRLNLRPNPVLETGRVSYDEVIQLLPRQLSPRLSARLKAMGSEVVGVRDCIEAMPGWLFYSVDYTGGELVTFAEACVERVGFSEMGKVLIAGGDVHALLGARIAGRTNLEDFKKSSTFKAFRQAAKPANFGFPGGMGALKLVLQQRASGPPTPHDCGPHDLGDGRRGYKGLRFCVLIHGEATCGRRKITEYGRGRQKRPCSPTCAACVEIAEDIRDLWFQQWPEAKEYLDWHSRHTNDGFVDQLYSGRRRGVEDFCSRANGDFQALLADIAARAQIRVTREQYLPAMESVLYGSRSILFAHDELFGEVLASRSSEVADRITEIMVEEFKAGCPHHALACKATPALMQRWYKAAEEVRGVDGRLRPWYPAQ